MSRQRFPCHDRDGHDKRSMLQQVWSSLRISRSRQNFPCRDRELSRLKVSRSRHTFLCRDILFYAATRVVMTREVYVTKEKNDVGT